MENENSIQNLIQKYDTKINKIFGNYFENNYINKSFKKVLQSEWLLPKEKINLQNESYVIDKFELFKNLGNKFIVTSKIIKIHYELDQIKIHKIEVRLEQVVAICYNGKNLIKEENFDNPFFIYDLNSNLIIPNFEFFHVNKKFYENLYKYNIVGTINKNEIYDNKLPHFNHDLETNLKENNLITSLIISTDKRDFIELSLKNSIIKNYEQFYISKQNKILNIKFLLGMNYKTNSNKWAEINYFKNSSGNIMMKNSSLMNESILHNLIKDLDINQYKSIVENKNNKINEVSGFSYEKVRKVQNYDWADEYFKKGKDMMLIKNYEKAIEHFRDAEKLDNLNKDVYIQKGISYLQIDKLEYAKKEFKNCLKIEPNDETAIKYLTYIVKKEKQNQVEEFYEQTMLNKKRKNE